MAVSEASDRHSSADSGVPAWRRARRVGLRHAGPVYRSGYVNAFLTGRVDDGRELALVAGTHSRSYPYLHPRSNWDDVLLIVGADTFRLSSRRISTLRLSLGPGNAAALSFNGRAYTPARAAVQIDFQFNLFAQIHKARPQGLGLIGMLWQPALVVGTGALTIHDRRLGVSRVVGEMERGTLTNLRGRLFQFGYDYFVTARESTAPAVCVEFRTYELHAGSSGLALRTLLRIRPARELLTLEGTQLENGDVHNLRPHAEESITVMVSNRVNLGPGTITRELVRVGSAERARFALREHIEANK